MLDIIKRLLLQIVDDIDADNSYLSEEEQIKVIKFLRKYSRKDEPMSKYQAYTYLNMSRASFDNMVREGKLPQGVKISGFKEKFWYKKDLDKYITKRNPA